MKIGIAGARGSIPTPTGNVLFGEKVETSKYGGNTTCIYVQADDGSEHIIDAGTGIRHLGIHLADQGGFNGKGKELNLYITHTHWDHIQGLPFFKPGYIPGNNINVFGEAKVKGVHNGIRASLEEEIRKHGIPTGDLAGVLSVDGPGVRSVLAGQQQFRNFPAPLDALASLKNFYDFVPGATIYLRGALTVDTIMQNHPGNSVAYRFTERKSDGSTRRFVFSTDFEPDANGYDDRLQEFWQGADLVLADAQYEHRGSSVKENPFMVGWGHSDYQSNLKMAVPASVGTLVLTHHEPKMGDSYHNLLEQRAQAEASTLCGALGKAPLCVEAAKEGRWYEL